MRRRAVLGTAGSLAVGLAGCVGNGGQGDPDDEGTVPGLDDDALRGALAAADLEVTGYGLQLGYYLHLDYETGAETTDEHMDDAVTVVEAFVSAIEDADDFGTVEVVYVTAHGPGAENRAQYDVEVPWILSVRAGTETAAAVAERSFEARELPDVPGIDLGAAASTLAEDDLAVTAATFDGETLPLEYVAPGAARIDVEGAVPTVVAALAGAVGDPATFESTVEAVIATGHARSGAGRLEYTIESGWIAAVARGDRTVEDVAAEAIATAP